MTAAKIDFGELCRRLLDSAETLVPRWLPHGRRNGAEWQSPNPLRDDRHVGSFSVNLVSGQWADFAVADARGGDLISLYAYLFAGGSQIDAARELAKEVGLRGTDQHASVPAAAEKRQRTQWVPILPVPADAPALPAAHVKRGRPERTWAYRDPEGRVIGHVYRFRTSDGGKEILPLVWARSADTGRLEWRWMQWAEPRPLYGLDRLRPGQTVLLVEGEKCADVGHEMLAQHFDVLTWSGGGNAVSKADWSALSGRQVLIWPDCDAQRDKNTQALLPEHDQPGIKAAEAAAGQLLELGCKVRIVRIPAPGERPGGWDIADAVEAGATAEDLLEILRQQREPGAAPRQQTRSATAAARAEGEAAAVGEDWESRLQRKRGEVQTCLANVALVLDSHAAWRACIGFDAFSMRTMKRRALPGRRIDDDDGEWTDIDTSRTIIWLTTHYGMTPGAQMVDEAVELIARANAFHPVREYLAGLAWDGVPRLEDWLQDCLGVPKTEYTMRVARWYPIAMVARVFDPGCKFDYCLVLEGSQGRRKSSFLRALAGDWFSDTDLDLSNKDSMSALRGKWVHEVAEMGSLARAESSRQKSFLSRQIDEFRPAYARREIRSPRQLVFAGTTNEWSWNKDPTGGRRFWPVEVQGDTEIDVLRAMRDQLFAEALVAYRRGDRYWPTSDEQREIFDPEQLKREAEDGLFDKVHDWLESRHLPEFTMGDVLEDALKLDAGRITRDVTTRVGALLHKLGCGKRERRNGVVRFVYTVPSWSSYGRAQAARQDNSTGVSDGPLPI